MAKWRKDRSYGCVHLQKLKQGSSSWKLCLQHIANWNVPAWAMERNSKGLLLELSCEKLLFYETKKKRKKKRKNLLLPLLSSCVVKGAKAKERPPPCAIVGLLRYVYENNMINNASARLAVWKGERGNLNSIKWFFSSLVLYTIFHLQHDVLWFHICLGARTYSFYSLVARKIDCYTFSFHHNSLRVCSFFLRDSDLAVATS